MTTDREYSEAMERVRLNGLAQSVTESSEGVGTFLTAFVLTLVLLIGGLTWVGFAYWGWVR